MVNFQSILSGLGNHFMSEAIEGALPLTQNSPQKAPFDLYPEQISGSAFTCPRETNRKTWCYRIQPSVTHGHFIPYHCSHFADKSFHTNPNQLRFSAFEPPKKATDFIDGLIPIANNPCGQICLFSYNQSMENTGRYFYNADGEYLLVPYSGQMHVKTELGELIIAPGHISVIPRGVVFQIADNASSGYLIENKGQPFCLPDLGPIGSNGLANPHHFISPQASFEDKTGKFQLFCKYQGEFWCAPINHSPLNVVAFKGNYLPYQYDLSLFNTINTVSFDHPDPSIFTVLTSPSQTSGVANIDFVIFPERWMVAEHTFRPPYFHRNTMSEFMGLLMGQYDAKEEGFDIGGFSIHNQFSAHGPDSETFDKASAQELKPTHYKNTLAFMFESCKPWELADSLAKHPKRQKHYQRCWQNLEARFVQNS